MSPHEFEHFEMLRNGPRISSQYVKDFYGLSWPLSEDIKSDYEKWTGQLKRRHACDDESMSRFELESFMGQKRVLPKKWMAARLGMNEASLDELLSCLSEIGMRSPRYVVYSELISGDFSDDIVLNLPNLKFRTFSNHNSFCAQLHSELKQVLGMTVQPLFCATSEEIEDNPRQYAHDFDCLTLAPLSTKHQMWLDFQKPINLGPDRCSKLLYVENRKLLRSHLAGMQEPGDLEGYKQFLVGQVDG